MASAHRGRLLALMTGQRNNGAPPTRPRGGPAASERDENLPLAEPDAVREVGSVPSSSSPAGRPSDRPHPPHQPIDLLGASVLADELTEGQRTDHVSSPSPHPALVPPPGSHRQSPERARSDADPPETRVGTTLVGRYRLERVIAKGGMGRVYLATQLPLERRVAIKLLVNQRNDAEFRKRFFLEASTCARLVHRHIVTVHDYGEGEDGELFMAMEYLDGMPLSKVIQRQLRLPSERACNIALQVCRALRAAHKTGVVHRDLKPGNVIVLNDEDQDGNDFIKVLDFGLVKAFQGADASMNDLTKSGTWLGSPRYMAPEQIRCQPVDPRTDIYSLGVILFHMLTGRPPFVGAHSMEVLEQHLRDRPPTIAEVLGGADPAPELGIIIDRCLRKDVAHRYQSMDELIGDLKAAYRLITGVSLYTESTLPTFAEIADPSAAFPPPRNVPLEGLQPAGSTPLVVTEGDRVALFDEPSAQGGRVSGVVRAPLEMLDSPTPSGRAPALPELTQASPSVSQAQIGSLVGSSGSLKWIGLAVALLLVVLAGFFSVKLVGLPATMRVTVKVESKPSGAEVWLDGRKLGETPLVHSIAAVTPGTNRVFVVRKRGHQDLELPTPLDSERVNLHAALVPTPRPKPIPIPQRPAEPPPSIEPEPVRGLDRDRSERARTSQSARSERARPDARAAGGRDETVAGRVRPDARAAGGRDETVAGRARRGLDADEEARTAGAESRDDREDRRRKNADEEAKSEPGQGVDRAPNVINEDDRVVRESEVPVVE